MYYASKIIIILSIAGLILPALSFVWAQNEPTIHLPTSAEEMKEVGFKVVRLIPALFKGIWQGLVDFCLFVWNDLKNIWNSYIFPFLSNLFEKTIGKEIKERKPVIEEEFKKEKEEVKEEIKTKLPTGKSMWEKFKELIK